MLVSAAAGIVLALPGCTYYVPPPSTTVVPGAPASFDRSFSAAAGAMRDQGLSITTEDRNSGTVVGKIGSGTVTANVRQQADGSVRVQFDSAGVSDGGLMGRISSSYERRMGR
jgi:hypothetical protein